MSETKEALRVTEEYSDTISYMQDILLNEFPIPELTIEYLILSILDNNRCHANIILDNILMNDTMNYLRGYYTEKVRSAAGNTVMNIDNVQYNHDLNRLFGAVIEEAQIQNAEKIGTEHILLTILNSEHHFEYIAKKLKEFGLDYEYVLRKCPDFIKDEIKKMPKKEISVQLGGNTPKQCLSDGKTQLKSEINSRSFVVSDNTPYIDKYTIDIHEEIIRGKYDKLIGRDDILNNIIKVLSRRKKNNVILVGKPGVGCTSMVYRLAEMIDSQNVPSILENKKVIMLDVMALVSGTHLRGMFEERVDGLFKELKNNPNYILFIDDMQNVVKNTSKDKDGDLTDMIGNILSEGDVRVIGTIHFKDYRNGIENNAMLSRKLQKIIVEPSSKEDTIEILKANKHYYENFHHVKFNDDVVYKAVKLAKRYITNNNLPDSAIDVLDLTGAAISLTNKQNGSLKELKEKLNMFDEQKKIAMNSGNFEELDEISKEESKIEKSISDMQKKLDRDDSTWLNATEDDVEEIVSSITNIPVAKMKATEKSSILHIEDILKKDIIGQDKAIHEVAKAIKRSRAGFGNKDKTSATILCLGQSGIGKTLLAKKLAENVYGDEKALIRFDMSEYQDKTSVNKLIGSSAGYVGYENGGLLTEAVKNKPYCVLLFDEIEKADESIYSLFLQLFDEGRLTDNNGVTVNFKNVIVIMTSNVGAKQAAELGSGVGFQSNQNDNQKAIIEKSLRQKFNPEFLNRIDKIIQFNPLSDENLKSITKLEIDKVVNRVKENNVTLLYSDKVIDYVYNKAVNQKEYGARPIMRLIQDEISDKVVDLVLSSSKRKNKYQVDVNENNEIVASCV